MYAPSEARIAVERGHVQQLRASPTSPDSRAASVDARVRSIRLAEQKERERRGRPEKNQEESIRQDDREEEDREEETRKSTSYIIPPFQNSTSLAWSTLCGRVYSDKYGVINRRDTLPTRTVSLNLDYSCICIFSFLLHVVRRPASDTCD